jgi:hypothetical protein
MRPLSSAISGSLPGLLRAAALSPGKVKFSWNTAVGPALARVTAVHLEGTTLLVDTPSPEWRREVLRSSPVILRRLQTFLGEDTVTEIVVRA